MENNNLYWNGLEEYNATPDYEASLQKEFTDELPIEESLSEESLGLKGNRRDFLKVFGFGLTAAALAACETPLKKAIPYVVKPDTVTPGVASWYASTCKGCAAGCGLTVKTREGRPIKVEGNALHALSKGGVCGVGQGTVLNLYDAGRLTGPKMGGAEATWATVDAAVVKAMGAGNARILTGTVNSPATLKVIEGLLATYPGTQHIQYDAISFAGIAQANQKNFGKAVVPSYNFLKADVIVSFDADFLGSWISPIQFTKDYSQNRRLDPKNPRMSKHYQFEAVWTVTGSKADIRMPVSPSMEGQMLVGLYNEVAALSGAASVSGGKTSLGPGNILKVAAKELFEARGKSLVVCGTNDVAAQEITNAINQLLGNYGKTINLDSPSYQANGDDAAMASLVSEMKNGAVNTLITWDVNPVYDYYDAEGFKQALGKVKNKVAMVSRQNETSELADVVCALSHEMESWDIISPRKGYYSIQQPTIRTIFDTRPAPACFMAWASGKAPEANAWYNSLKTWWTTDMFMMQSSMTSAKNFWNKFVQDGVFELGMPVSMAADMAGDSSEIETPLAAPVILADASGFNVQVAASELASSKLSGMEVVLYEKLGIRNGKFANNPWLQEMPDPITKATWDNYVMVPYTYAKENNISDGEFVKLSAGKYSVELPALVMPGQAVNTFGVAVGYGRGEIAGKVAGGLGKNAFPFGNVNKNLVQNKLGGATLEKTGGKTELAKTQYYMGYDLLDEGGPTGGVDGLKGIENRISNSILKETTLAEYKENLYAGNTNRAHIQHENTFTLWSIHDKKGHHWGMAIDLNACTGCSACVVSCNAENNIPVVGKKEVATRRELHWMRIDRYFRGDPNATDGSLQMLHQPLMCQHCDNAPCESVCPVLATVHSDEGLNQQAYNRCIGTRYCSNNCPYKVRRFNWFSYYDNSKFEDVNNHMFNDLGRLVLNPDVTVRARGVMEKCSFCVQRIQESKLKAKVAKTHLPDGSIKTACQQSCPADAIVFGDMNDPNSEIFKMMNNERAFNALEEVKTYPSVHYLTQVRNNNFKIEKTVPHKEPATEETPHS